MPGRGAANQQGPPGQNIEKIPPAHFCAGGIFSRFHNALKGGLGGAGHPHVVPVVHRDGQHAA